MFPVLVPDLRQADSTNDRYNSNNNGEYKYQRLTNTSMSNSESSLNIYEVQEDKLLNLPNKMVKSNSDQKLPESVPQSFIYVNKNGHAVNTVVSPSRVQPKRCYETTGQVFPKGKEMICNSFLVDLVKSNNNSDHQYGQRNYESLRQNILSTDSTSDSFDKSFNNNSLVQQTNEGVRINTSLTIQEPNIEITSEHVKYINLFSFLCCWCFPFTGIIGIIYARLTSKYYKLRDLSKAKKFLKRSEWMLIATFFFGFTIISLVFSYLQHYYFSEIGATSRFGLPYLNHTRHQMLFMPTVLPKK